MTSSRGSDMSSLLRVLTLNMHAPFLYIVQNLNFCEVKFILNIPWLFQFQNFQISLNNEHSGSVCLVCARPLDFYIQHQFLIKVNAGLCI